MKLLDDKSTAIPWQAKIITVKDNTVFINAGSEAGVQVGDVFYIYSEGKALIDPDTGISLGSIESKIVKIEVTNNNLGNGDHSIGLKGYFFPRKERFPSESAMMAP
ncbi:hypothetical protein ES703_44790 [subsurface metagenome]